MIAPGGGNIMLMYGAEGLDVAEVFNDWGVTAFVLTYRLSPRYHWQDWYARDYYGSPPRENPRGPETGAYRVVRGGSFFVEAFDLRTSARSAAWPSLQAHRMIGFRAVREP